MSKMSDGIANQYSRDSPERRAERRVERAPNKVEGGSMSTSVDTWEEIVREVQENKAGVDPAVTVLKALALFEALEIIGKDNMPHSGNMNHAEDILRANLRQAFKDHYGRRAE